MGNEEFHTVRGYQLMEQKKKLLTPAMEDYLEMIYRNIRDEGYMRINKISELLNVQPPSATKMVQKLARLGYLDYKKYGIIFLTERGKSMGKFLLDRHNVIETFLKSIGIKENLLIETELIEHNVSINTLKCIDHLNSFLKTHPEVLGEFEKFKASNNLGVNSITNRTNNKSVPNYSGNDPASNHPGNDSISDNSTNDSASNHPGNGSI
jgi:DtxR family Mn-dependent transcriptional regulator